MFMLYKPPLVELLSGKKVSTGIPDEIQDTGILKADRQKGINRRQDDGQKKSLLCK